MNHTASTQMSDHVSVEDIVLRYSGRGMNILQQYLQDHYCRHAAERILALERGNILLTTGFYVGGHPETDGPPGTMALAVALKKLGFHPTIVTDHLCEGLFEPEQLDVEYVDTEADSLFFQKLLNRYRPVCLISVERCGRNLNEDYANMRGVSIASQTAQIDTMFQLAARSHILTIGIGDGGNEIGMGNLKDVILHRLSLNPCTVTVDELIIATTSNWGAYALVTYLSILNHSRRLISHRKIAAYIDRIVASGCVDGVTKKHEPSVDGFSSETEKEIITALTVLADQIRIRKEH